MSGIWNKIGLNANRSSDKSPLLSFLADDLNKKLINQLLVSVDFVTKLAIANVLHEVALWFFHHSPMFSRLNTAHFHHFNALFCPFGEFYLAFVQ